MQIKQAQHADIHVLVILFEAYREFYGQKADLPSSRKFLQERFENQENIVFIAYEEDEPMGFTQLYKTFSSVSLQPFYILNDLFVYPEFRKKGVGKALLEHAKYFCETQGFKGLVLETAVDNPAQKLYERLGWKKDEEYLHYFWTNSKSN